MFWGDILNLIFHSLHQLSYYDFSDEESYLSIYSRARQHARDVSIQVESFLGFVSSTQISTPRVCIVLPNLNSGENQTSAQGEVVLARCVDVSCFCVDVSWSRLVLAEQEYTGIDPNRLAALLHQAMFGRETCLRELFHCVTSSTKHIIV